MDFKGVYFKLWKEAWEFHKKWCNNAGTGNEWEGIVTESGNILRQYEDKPEHDFMKSLLLAIVDELERIDKERRKEK